MRVYSTNKDGSYNHTFYALLSAGKLTNISPHFDFENNTVVLKGTVCPDAKLKEREEPVNERYPFRA